MSPAARQTGERLLVVQTAFLGDVVLTTPLLRELRRVRPGSRISVLTTEAGAGLLAGLPWVDELLSFDKAWSRRGIPSSARLFRTLVGARFDVAIAAQRSTRTGLLVRLSGARTRIGFAGAPGRWAYTTCIARDPAVHAVRRYLALADPLGAESARADPRPALAIDPLAEERVEALLREAGVTGAEPILALAPGSARATKRWSPAGFAAVAAEAPRLGLRPVLLGSPTERELCEAVGRGSGVRPPVLAGRIDVTGMIALVARSRALVANDSGPGHVASAVGTPVVTVYGPTSRAHGHAPWGEGHRAVELAGLACRPCSRRGPRSCPLGHFRCMRELSPPLVLAALESLLETACLPSSTQAGPTLRRRRPG